MRSATGGVRHSVLSLIVAPVALAASGCGLRERARAEAAFLDAWGRPVALLPAPGRIVSLSPATTELVFALGAGERLVGRTTWCDWPPAARAIPDVGDGIGPNLEAVMARRPDLVLVYPSEANRAAVSRLEALGIRVAVVRQDAISDWRIAARSVGRLLGAAAAAESLLDDFERRLAAARAEPAGDRLSVFAAAGSNPPLAIGRGSFLSELIELAGGRNAFSDLAAPSAVVSLEAVAVRDPDLVLVLGPDSATWRLDQRPGWRAVRAVREGQVLAVEGSEFNRPSPRLPEAVRALASRLAASGAARARGARGAAGAWR